MEQDILSVIRYFDRFDYSPTTEEIYSFFPRRISLSLLNKRLDILLRKKKLTSGQTMGNFNRFSFYRRRKLFALQKRKEKISQKKISKINFYLKLLSIFPQIKLVGLSGSLAMMNANKNDDIDLFIITARNRLFTGRFIAILLAQLLGIRRLPITNYRLRITRDKVCLNLFFDEKSLLVPSYKATPYVAHEILQMKPVVIRGDIYQRFLKENKWVYKMFPNAINSKFEYRNLKQIQNLNFLNSKRLEHLDLCHSILFRISSFVLRILSFYIIESLLKKLQLYFINRHRTTEIVTASQLWFHPVDFGERMKGKDHEKE